MSVIRIKIESDTLDSTVVHPLWSGEIDQKREEDGVFFRSVLGGDFEFFGDDYTLIKTVPECERITIELEENCNGTWTRQWRGRFTLYDMTFNDTTCTAKVRPEIRDNYECFMDQINTEYIVENTDAISTKGLRNNYQPPGFELHHFCTDAVPYEIAAGLPTDPVCSFGVGGVNDGSLFCFDNNSFSSEISLMPGFAYVYSRYHRVLDVTFTSDPPPYDTGWEIVFTDVATTWIWWRCPPSGVNQLGKLDNGRLFNDTLNLLGDAATCGLTVRSHFFGLNNTHTAAPANDAYTYATAYMQNLSLHQKSDVKRPDSSNESQDFVWKMTWKKLLDDLRIMFNVYWIINDDNELIIEHISYFEAQAGVDISAKNIVVEYGKGDTSAPRTEKFFWMDKDASFTEEHAGFPISYGSCGNDTKEYQVGMFSNDIFYIRSVENQEEIADNGFCLVSNDVVIGGGLFGADAYYVNDGNAPMGFMLLHENLHKHYRYFESGLMNEEPTEFLSTRKSRKMEPFTVDICCDDGFNPEDYMITRAGNVTVEKATINYFSGKNNRSITIESSI